VIEGLPNEEHNSAVWLKPAVSRWRVSYNQKNKTGEVTVKKKLNCQGVQEVLKGTGWCTCAGVWHRPGCPGEHQENRFDGIHGAQRQAEAAGSLPGALQGEVQGTFAQKYKNCEIRDIYTALKHEEFPQFQLSAILLAKLKN